MDNKLQAVYACANMTVSTFVVSRLSVAVRYSWWCHCSYT